jgi:hypothetical protein
MINRRFSELQDYFLMSYGSFEVEPRAANIEDLVKEVHQIMIQSQKRAVFDIKISENAKLRQFTTEIKLVRHLISNLSTTLMAFRLRAGKARLQVSIQKEDLLENIPRMLILDWQLFTFDYDKIIKLLINSSGSHTERTVYSRPNWNFKYCRMVIDAL